MYYVITLSSLLTVRPIHTKNPADDWYAKDFAELYNYQSSMFSGCPDVLPTSVTSFYNSVSGTLFKGYKTPSILKLFWDHEATTIHQYKIGELKTEDGQTQTEAFAEILFEKFSFLGQNTHLIPDSVKDNLWAERKRLLATKDLEDKEELTGNTLAQALLQKTWCGQNIVTEEDWAKIDALIMSGEKVIFEGNANPMHAEYFHQQLKERHPDIDWIDDSEDLPRQIAPNLYWARSYEYHTYADKGNNEKRGVDKPTMTEEVIKKFGPENVLYISHFSNNRDEAEQLGAETKTPEEFFKNFNPQNIEKEEKKYV